MRAGLAMMSALAAACIACEERFPKPNEVGGLPSFDAGADAADDAGVPIVVTTHAPSLDVDRLGVPANVTWAAWLDDDGWHALSPSAVGTYTFRTRAARWSIALACAASDASNAEVVVASRRRATTALDVQAAGLCTPIPPATFIDLTGTISGAPLGTTLLEFGYADASGLRPVTVAGDGSAPYLVFGVLAGTWDLAYATRDSGASPITRMRILRQRVIGPQPIDVDFSSAFVPGAKSVTVAGLGDAEPLVGQVWFTTNGASLGLGMAPETLGASFSYGTVAKEMAIPSDRYRLSLEGAKSDDERRALDASFREPIDLALTMPAPLAVPRVTAIPGPYLRLRTELSAATTLTTIDASTSPSPSRRYRWLQTTDDEEALGVEMPDFGTTAGWNAAWALPAGGPIKVVVTRTEAPTPLGDGSLVRSSSRVVIVGP